MDDFVILAKDMKELEERTIQFLKIAEKHNLCFKQLKCNFNRGNPNFGSSHWKRTSANGNQ